MAMTIRNLDDDGDWCFGKSNQDYVSQNQAIALNVKTRILCWLNDCFFDKNAGIDWYNRLGMKGQRTLLELDLKRIILQSTGVKEITDFSTDLVGRNFTAYYEINTIYTGIITDSVTV